MDITTLSPAELSIAAAALRDRVDTLRRAAGTCSEQGDQDGRQMALSQAKSAEALATKLSAALTQ